MCLIYCDKIYIYIYSNYDSLNFPPTPQAKLKHTADLMKEFGLYFKQDCKRRGRNPASMNPK